MSLFSQRRTRRVVVFNQRKVCEAVEFSNGEFTRCGDEVVPGSLEQDPDAKLTCKGCLVAIARAEGAAGVTPIGGAM